MFNICQVEGLVWKLPEMPESQHRTLQLAERLVKFLEPKIPKINAAGGKAYYSPLIDQITMPKVSLFWSSETYYATLFHEIIHSTGHEKRLKRYGVTQQTNFQSYAYGKEELIAIMRGSLLGQEAEINNDTVLTNSAAYLQSWLNTIKEDKRILITAAAQAQKAVDWLPGTRFEDDHE